MKRFELIANKVIVNFVMALFGIIILYLAVLSIFSTSYLSTSYTNGAEYTYYVPDTPLLHLAFFAFVIVAAAALFHYGKRRNISHITDRIFRYMPYVWMGITLLWVISTQVRPGADQRSIMDAATHMRNGDFSDFTPQGYMGMNPHQIGLTLFVYLTSFIFGSDNYIAFQFMNVAALFIIYHFMKKITVLLYEKDNIANVTYFAMICFLPLSFYVTFVYGTLFGLMLSVLGMYFEIQYIKNRSPKDILLGALCIAAAPIFKSNYLIMMIAFILILLSDVLIHTQWASFLGVVITVCLYLMGNLMVDNYVEHITGLPVQKGIPSSSYIAMGLQDSQYLAEGWYTGYVRSIYKYADYDYDAADKMSRVNISESIDNFRQNSDYTLTFFTKKIASQWNNPTFQCYWIYLVRSSMITPADTINNIYNGTASRILALFLNLFQSLMLLGVITYIIYYRREHSLISILPAVIFIGGFIFHLIWEAKAQYTLPYFFLIIPYGVAGMKRMAQDIENALRTRNFRCPAFYIFCTMCAVVLVIALINTDVINTMFKLSYDAGLYHSEMWN